MPACRRSSISVNVSRPPVPRTQLGVAASPKRSRESGLEARYLELELTESLIMQDVGAAVATMHELQALGVHLPSTISAPAIPASAR